MELPEKVLEGVSWAFSGGIATSERTFLLT